MSNNNNDNRPFRLPSGAMGDLPAYGMSDHEYTEQLLNGSNRQQPKQEQQSTNNNNPYQKAASADPTGIRAIIQYVKPRWDAMQPQMTKLWNKNWNNQKYFGDTSNSTKLEITCAFCGLTKEWKYDEIESHVYSHSEFKALTERARAVKKKQRELNQTKQAAYEKLQEAQSEYDKSKYISEYPGWDFDALNESREYLMFEVQRELGLI